MTSPDSSLTTPYPLTREQNYTNGGYPTLTLTVNGTSPSKTGSIPQETLHCLLHYDQWPISISFQHISGEYFLAYFRFYTAEARNAPDDYETATDGLSKAEFRLGEDGKVKELGIMLEQEMGGAKIWFKKEGTENRDGYESIFEDGSSAIKTESYQGRGGARGQSTLFSRPGKALAPLFA